MGLSFGISAIFAAEPLPEELPDFTPSFSIVSAYSGDLLVIDERMLNWNLRDIVNDSFIRNRDPWRFLKLSYVQFVRPDSPDTCLAISQSGRFVGKSCRQDLMSGNLETVFSIIPTTTSAVQIRSMVLNANECITYFTNPRESGFSITTCDVDELFDIGLRNLMLIVPPFQAASPINPD